MQKIGEPEPAASIKPIPSGFHSLPLSLRSAINVMNPPLIEGWTLVGIDNFNNQERTENCQGIVTDGNLNQGHGRISKQINLLQVLIVTVSFGSNVANEPRSRFMITLNFFV